jgi:hypothetical protein
MAIRDVQAHIVSVSSIPKMAEVAALVDAGTATITSPACLASGVPTG